MRQENTEKQVYKFTKQEVLDALAEKHDLAWGDVPPRDIFLCLRGDDGLEVVASKGKPEPYTETTKT
jgi:hypothetical protein